MTIHKNLAKGKWKELSLVEQMANIGSEAMRVISWKGKNETNAKNSFIRTLELINLSLNDKKNNGRLKEIARVKEVWSDWFLGNRKYKTTNEQWKKYFLQFAKAARKEK